MKKRLLQWKIFSLYEKCETIPWRSSFLFILSTTFSLILSAQQSAVRGRVTAGDSSLAGVTVQVKGTTTTTQTDENGRFSINAPSNGTLVLTSIGFTTREVAIN